LRRGLIVLAAALAVGCEQPPSREIDAAQAEVEAARKEGAEQYAPDRWREAQDALKAARDNVAGKDYRAALSSANLAAESARAAVQAVQASRAAARTETETLGGEVRARLEEVAAVQKEALAATVPDEAFTALSPRVQDVQAGLDRVVRTLAEGDALNARRMAGELKAQADELPTAFRQAAATWKAEHPKGGRRRRR
jgi:hypothetical protein